MPEHLRTAHHMPDGRFASRGTLVELLLFILRARTVFFLGKVLHSCCAAHALSKKGTRVVLPLTAEGRTATQLQLLVAAHPAATQVQRRGGQAALVPIGASGPARPPAPACSPFPPFHRRSENITSFVHRQHGREPAVTAGFLSAEFRLV
jgi:hypothetical protein